MKSKTDTGPWAEAQRLLVAGRHAEALDAFGRILLREPGHRGAREGVDAARLGLAEHRRVLDARLQEAEDAWADGNEPRARALLEEVVGSGGDRDRARALLDRMPVRMDAAPAVENAAAPVEAEAPRRLPERPARSRHALAAVWTLAFAGLGAGVGWSWESIVGSLTRPPTPTTLAVLPSSLAPVAPPDARAVAEAERLLKLGEAEKALLVLEAISPLDASYPFARELKGQAERAMREREPKGRR